MRVFLLALCAIAMLSVGCSSSRSSKRENVAPPAELTDFAPQIQVRELWSGKVGGGEGKTGLRQRVAIDGRVVFTSDQSGDVQALDLDTGRQLWRRETGLRVSSSPAAGESTLVVATLDGQVLALNPDNGDERWRATVSSEVIAQPAISRGLVVVRVNDGRVFAFSATDGERRWVYDRGIPALTLRGNSAPEVADGRVYLGYDGGQVVALNLETGAQVWEQVVAVGEGRTELDRMVDVDGALVVDGGQIFAASFRGQAIAIDSISARPLWNREISSYAGVVSAAGQLLTVDDQGTLWSLDRSTGSAMWKQDVLSHRWLSAPAVQSNYALVGDLEGYVHWFSLTDGALVARAQLGDEAIVASPVVSADGVAVVVSTSGKIAAYRLGD
ncbi:MAG: outer membrane protein assembly factor BamB [Lysobacteraceae bacterium]